MMTLLSAIRARPTTAAGPSPAGVPDIEYPSPLAELPDEPLPFVVKNTFVDTADCRPSSLLGSSDFEPRGVRSCPGSRCAGVRSLDSCCEEGEAPNTSRSRSTSAGASSRASVAGEEPAAQDGAPVSRCSSSREGSEAPSSPATALPEFNYPTPEFSVRNTFVDTRIGQLPSMVDEAFEERKTRSCPSSGLGEPGVWASLPDAVARLRATDDEDFVPAPAACSPCAEEDEDDFTPSPAFCPADQDEDCEVFVPAPLPTWASIDAMEDLVQECQLPPPPQHWAPLSFVPPPPPPPVAPPALPGKDEARMPSPAVAAAMADASSPSIAELVLDVPAQPLLGSPECPTVGSRLHCQGTCKPCAHAFTKGCANGVDCQFCHLCEPGELKRRQKERRAQLARQQAMDSRAEGCSSGTARGRRGGKRA